MLIHQVNEENFGTERVVGEAILKKKYALFDSLQHAPITEQKLKEEVAELFKDPTIWSYGTLFNKQGKRLTLWYYQDKVINDKNRFVHVTASNQVGKTLAMCIKAAHHALYVPNASVMVISKSEQQAAYVLDEIKWFLRKGRIDYTEIAGEVENRTELHLQGPNNSTSVIRCFPPTTTALGFPASLLLCDEVAFWEKISELSPTEYYDQVLEPRTNQTKNWEHPFLTMGQIVFITNPNGQNGLAWRSFANDQRFNCYKYNWLANPFNTIKEYTQAKNRLPIYRFASIYAAEYVSADGGFITNEQYEHFASFDHPLLLPRGTVLFLGGDFAGEDVRSKGRDFNTLYGLVHIPDQRGLAPKLRLVYVREWPAGTKKSIIYEEIKKLASMCSIGMFCYDKVGVGDKVKSDLIDLGVLNEYQIEPLTYSLQNKSEVFINLQRLFETGSVEGRDIQKLRDQLLGLQVVQMEGSVHLKIHHKTEGLHDDHPDALANACWAARKMNAVPVTLSFLGNEQAEQDCRHASLKHTAFGELACVTCGEDR